MHKIHAKEFTIDDFSYEHIDDTNMLWLIPAELNKWRALYLETNDKKYWWQMIQILPTSYNQKRTVMLNYAVLRNMYHARKNHKLDEWHRFCEWIETLPYSELITEDYKNGN
jgi:diadenosine tetraphosphatase ApaH/serine/threonine PP2A family protein phosphatase